LVILTLDQFQPNQTVAAIQPKPEIAVKPEACTIDDLITGAATSTPPKARGSSPLPSSVPKAPKAMIAAMNRTPTKSVYPASKTPPLFPSAMVWTSAKSVATVPSSSATGILKVEPKKVIKKENDNHETTLPKVLKIDRLPRAKESLKSGEVLKAGELDMR